MNNKAYFTSSNTNVKHCYEIYLADIIQNLWKENNSENNDNYNVDPILDFPSNIENYKLKNRRIKLETEFKKRLNSLYDEGKDILEIKRSISNSKSMQTKYAFTDDFKNIILKCVEVNCRMITTNMSNQGNTSFSSSSSSFNLSRIGNIIFKGEMKLIIEELMEKCKTELEEKYKQQINEIKSAAMYIPEHNDNLCNWKCVSLEKHIKKQSEYYLFFNSEENNTRNKPLCYQKRQLIGQEIIPFIDENEEKEEEDDLISCKQNQYIFDNLFYKNELCGVKKKYINYTPNFLNTVERDECTALLSFTLDYVGVTTGLINLYLKPLQGCNVIYCTNISSGNNLPKASTYLKDKLFTNKNIVDILKTKYEINIPKYIENYYYKEEKEEEEQEEEKENKKRKLSNNSGDDSKKRKNSSSSSSSSSSSNSSSSDNDDDNYTKYQNNIVKNIKCIKY